METAFASEGYNLQVKAKNRTELVEPEGIPFCRKKEVPYLELGLLLTSKNSVSMIFEWQIQGQFSDKNARRTQRELIKYPAPLFQCTPVSSLPSKSNPTTR